MTTTVKTGLEMLANSASNQLLANASFAQIDQLLQTGVADKDLTAPPGSPSNGVLYIVASSPTGAWSGQAGNLAYWLTSVNAWTFITPRAGWRVSVLDELDSAGLPKIYGYTGSAWVEPPVSGGAGGSQAIAIACSDESTALTAGTEKVTFRMPYAMSISGVRASLTVAQAGGSIFTVDINEAGSSILSTKITIDNTEKSSVTAAAAPVLSDTSLADDAEITVDIDQIGDGTAKGLKVYIIGVPL